MSNGTGMTNAERTDARVRRQTYLERRVPDGIQVNFDDLWDEMEKKGLTKGVQYKNFKGTLHRYGYRSRDNMIMRRDTPLPPRIRKQKLPPEYNPSPEWALFHKVSARLGRTFREMDEDTV